MSELFTLPEKIPQQRQQIPLYRTTELKTLSPRESTVARYFDRRLKKYREIFMLTQEPEDNGDILTFKEKKFDFEVYKASDSFWMTNRELAFSETLPRGAELPKEDEAADKAREYLEKHYVDMTYVKFQSVTHTEVVHDGPDKKEIDSQKTAVNVNFSFDMDGIPVVGPGAKIQVSFCDRDLVSQVYYFWRDAKIADEMDSILPDNALEKFMKDPQFIRLDERSSSVKIHEMNLNYFAMPPFEFQRFLIPVYTIKGTVSTKHLERYDFNTHVVAVNITPEKIKRAGILANPSSCQVFD